MKQPVGLRIDVDTVGGFTKGVVPLVRLLDRLNIRATFFIVTGYDSPLRDLPRIFSERGFAERALKLKKSALRAVWGGSGSAVKESVRAIQESDHELALHGFHHFRWQLHLRAWGADRIEQEIEAGRRSFKLLTGRYPHAFAAPGWETTARFFTVLDRFKFAYSSDTRGVSPFYPLVEGISMRTLQIPVTLPTLDELMGLGGAEELANVRAKAGDVYCAHAEFDGMTHFSLFESFLEENLRKGCSFVPLIDMANRRSESGVEGLEYRYVPGRTRVVTWQKATTEDRRQRADDG